MVCHKKSERNINIQKQDMEQWMDTTISFGVIAGVCGLVLIIAVLKQRAQLMLNFLVRTALGAICILFVNDFLKEQGIALVVGLNPVSLLTAGILGFSGIALLYAIVACKFL